MKKIFLFAIFAFIIIAKAFPQADFNIDGKPCKNNLLQFTDKSVLVATKWEWLFGDGGTSTEQNPTHAYSDTGLFVVNLTITSNGNKYEAKPKTIKIFNLPNADFTIDSTTVHYSSYSRIFTDASKSNNSIKLFLWNFGNASAPLSTTSTSTQFKYSEKGEYTVWLKVTDNEGCTDSVSKQVQIHDRFMVPNVFTPNNDLINDEFIITSNGETLFSIEIYSRWGNLVFKREGHQQIVWDGCLPDGTTVNAGTYYYVLNAETGNITYDPQKGFITVFH